MRKDEPFRHLVKKTRFGPAAILWESVSGKPRVRQILLTKPGKPAQAALKEQFPGSAPSSCGLIEDLAGRIAAFLDGADVHFFADPSFHAKF